MQVNLQDANTQLARDLAPARLERLTLLTAERTLLTYGDWKRWLG